jgi:hypothetical protein
MNKTITDVTVASEFAEDYLHTFPNDPRTEHQLGAVHLYTQGWSDSSESLYAKLNRDLASEDRKLMVKWFAYLKLLISGISAEPKVSATVWRGVKADIAKDYPKDKKFRWWRFSSCTEEGDVLKNPMFLGETGKRTLFSIDCTSGVKINHLSAYTAEAEVLIPPGTRFQVMNTITTAELTVVILKEIKCGLTYNAEQVPPPPTTSSSSGETKVS